MNFCLMQLIKAAQKTLWDQCDPYPLLNEIEVQMTYKNSEHFKQLLLIEYSLVLQVIGEYNKAMEKLESVNIENYAKKSPSSRSQYFGRLASIHLCLNDIEKAELNINRSIEILNGEKNKKLKSMSLMLIQYKVAELSYLKKDFDKSIEILNSIVERAKINFLHKAFLYAKNYIEQNKIDEAKVELQFVIQNVNKLIYVQIAKDLLAKI